MWGMVLDQLKNYNSYSCFFCDSAYSELFGESPVPLAPAPRASAPALTILVALHWARFPCPPVPPLPEAVPSIPVQMDPGEVGTSAGRDALA